MSPPIRDGSGNSIGSIRLGDGSEIAEVRTGAGDVLFSGSAIPDSVIDSFEDGDLTEYSSNSDFNVVTSSNATDGDNVLEGATNVNTFVAIRSETGLNDYPEEGDVFEYDLRITSDTGNIFGTSFGYNGSGSGNEYSVLLNGNDNDFTLKFGAEAVANGGTSLASKNQSYAVDTTYTVRVEWGSSGNIDVFLLDSNDNQLNELTGSTQSNTSGGVGYAINQKANTPSALWDRYVITDANAL